MIIIKLGNILYFYQSSEIVLSKRQRLIFFKSTGTKSNFGCKIDESLSGTIDAGVSGKNVLYCKTLSMKAAVGVFFLPAIVK